MSIVVSFLIEAKTVTRNSRRGCGWDAVESFDACRRDVPATVLEVFGKARIIWRRPRPCGWIPVVRAVTGVTWLLEPAFVYSLLDWCTELDAWCDIIYVWLQVIGQVISCTVSAWTISRWDPLLLTYHSPLSGSL